MKKKKRWHPNKYLPLILKNTNHNVTRIVTLSEKRVLKEMKKDYDLILLIGHTELYKKINRKNVMYVHDGLFLRDNKYDINYPFYMSTKPQFKEFVYESNMPSDRWNKIRSRGVEVKPWRKGGKIILIGYQYSNAYGISRTTLLKKELRRLTGLPIMFGKYPTQYKYGNIRIRYHPRMERLFEVNNPRTLESDLNRAKCLVTVDSTISVDAILHGVPVIILGKHPVNKIASKSVSNLRYPNRQPWLNWISYYHWSINDLRSDEWIKYYKRVKLLRF